jgi:hypothetical protein
MPGSRTARRRHEGIAPEPIQWPALEEIFNATVDPVAGALCFSVALWAPLVELAVRLRP